VVELLPAVCHLVENRGVMEHLSDNEWEEAQHHRSPILALCHSCEGAKAMRVSGLPVHDGYQWCIYEELDCPPQRTPVHLWLGWTAAPLVSALTAQHCQQQHPTAYISIVVPTVTVLQAWLWSTNIHLKTSCMKKIKTSKKMRAAWLAILRAAQEQSCSSVES